MQYQIHFNKKFYQDKKTGYWISTTCPKIRAHVWVWKQYHGEIPKKYHIHHKDENKSNNDISNLELISQSKHLSLHMQCPLRRAKASEMANTYRHMTKEWHRSEEGKSWHKAHGILSWINRNPIKVICKICSKEVETKTYHQEFCSNACKSKWRRQEGLDNIEKTCPICKKNYIVNKYARAKTCSRECGRELIKHK